MKNPLTKIGQSARYWILILTLGIALEAVALFYQYVLGYGPCVLCIHVRIYVMAFILVALVTMFTRRNPVLCFISHSITFLLSLGLAERSWKTFGVERGFIEGACDMDSGLPPWFALDKWFPLVFEPWEPCGYTPELLFGVTMAEALLAICAFAIPVSLLLAINALKK